MKISVIIPVYNGEKFISYALDSILSQTLKEIEIIIINDCSSDGTENILQYYSKKYNIKIINNKQNLGPGVSRNKGIEIACGEYIHFFDADDLLESTMFYENLYKIAIKNDLDILFFSFTTKYFDTKEFFRDTHFKYPENIVCTSIEDKNIFLRDGIFPTNKIVKRSLIKEQKMLFPPYSLCEDIYFHWIVIINAQKLMYYKDIYYTYFIRSDSLTRRKLDYHRFQNVIGVLETIKLYLIENAYFDVYKHQFVLFYLRKYCNLYKFSQFDNKKIFTQISEKVRWIKLSEYNFPIKYLKFKALIHNKYYLFNLLNLDFKKVFYSK